MSLYLKHIQFQIILKIIENRTNNMPNRSDKKTSRTVLETILRVEIRNRDETGASPNKQTH